MLGLPSKACWLASLYSLSVVADVQVGTMPAGAGSQSQLALLRLLQPATSGPQLSIKRSSMQCHWIPPYLLLNVEELLTGLVILYLLVKKVGPRLHDPAIRLPLVVGGRLTQTRGLSFFTIIAWITPICPL